MTLNKWKPLKTAGLLFGLMGICVNSSFAADKSGKFAVKGAGRMECSAYLKAKEQKSTDYLLYAGWVEGFLSSYNQFQKNTYDITPWQTTELLMVLIDEQCKKTPSAKILSVTSGMANALHPIRLKEEDKIVKLTLNGQDTYFYSEIIKQVKQRLKIAKLYDGDTKSDQFGPKEIEAITAFQKATGLTVTRTLDQSTLSALFLKKSK